MPWFQSKAIQSQTKKELTSKSTNTIDKEDDECTVYAPEKSLLLELPYPSIRDDTEGVPAFKSLMPMMPKDVNVILGTYNTHIPNSKKHSRPSITDRRRRRTVRYLSTICREELFQTLQQKGGNVCSRSFQSICRA